MKGKFPWPCVKKKNIKNLGVRENNLDITELNSAQGQYFYLYYIFK